MKWIETELWWLKMKAQKLKSVPKKGMVILCLIFSRRQKYLQNKWFPNRNPKCPRNILDLKKVFAWKKTPTEMGILSKTLNAYVENLGKINLQPFAIHLDRLILKPLDGQGHQWIGLLTRFEQSHQFEKLCSCTRLLHYTCNKRPPS